MTFATYETSLQDGNPVELYEFTVGVQTFRYTSAPEDIVYQTKTYETVQLSRSDIEDTGDIPKSQLTLTAQRDFPIADLFRVAPPSEVVAVNVYRLHLADGDAESKLIWTGRVLNCEWDARSTCTMTCESLYTALRRRGLRRMYQRQCPHTLYGALCGVPATSFRTVLAVNIVNGTSLSDPDIDVLPDGYLAGGYLEWEKAPGQYERRAIKTHVGDTITITHPIIGLAGGNEVSLFAGCDHSLTTCNSKFSNATNYGGFPFVPKSNPFGGTNVF
jgi:uncharacterized phage protein (TIGR02218 family)